MTPSQLRNDLQNIYDLMAEKGISLYNRYIVDIKNYPFRQITWHQSDNTISKTQYFGTYDQYLSIVKDNSFSCLLTDGSLLRISYTFNRNNLIGHNLWYYPCPLDLPEEDLIREPLGDLIEIYAKAGVGYWRFRGPIRFDYDAERAEELTHPEVHVHFIRDDCRTPAKRPLSPGTFFKFVFFNFYRELWNSHPFLRELPEEHFNQTIFPQEERLIHFSWR